MRITTRQLIAALAVAGMCGVGATFGVASTFLKADIPTLTQMSESVVHARVVNIQSDWNAERTMIFTHVALDVIRTLHGTAASQMVVRVPGGTVDGFTVEMSGAPEFKMHHNLTAFIARWDDGMPRVAGYFQGLSRVVLDRLGNPILRGGVADGLPVSELVRRLGPGRPGSGR